MTNPRTIVVDVDVWRRIKILAAQRDESIGAFVARAVEYFETGTALDAAAEGGSSAPAPAVAPSADRYAEIERRAIRSNREAERTARRSRRAK